MSKNKSTFKEDYKSLSKDYNKKLQKLNKRAWMTCKNILTDQSTYSCICRSKPCKSISALIFLIENSSNSNYRRIDLLGEILLNQELQIYPLNKTSDTANTDLKEIVNSVNFFYTDNPYLLALE